MSRGALLALMVMVGILTLATSAYAQQPQSIECYDASSPSLTVQCGSEFAEKFAPTLIVRSTGCNWDQPQSRLGGGYYYSAQRVDSMVRIAYMPAYFFDCGWAGAKCWLPAVGCAAHAGDSEFIALDLVRDSSATNAWRVAAIFLSAHCFGRSTGDCRWYRGNELAAFNWSGASVEIWVAEGRNGNYPSKRSCDRGHYAIDTCDRHDARYRFPVLLEKNIGSRAEPTRVGGCYAGSELSSALADARDEECFWSAAMFRGWQPGAPGVTGYDRYLREIARF